MPIGPNGERRPQSDTAWTTRCLWISFLVCGASFLFPPALLITAPIFAVATVVWVIAAIAGAVRGPAPSPELPADQSAEVDPSRIRFDVDKDGLLVTRVDGDGQ